MENNYDSIIALTESKIRNLESARDQLYREIDEIEIAMLHEEEILTYWLWKRKAQNEQGT